MFAVAPGPLARFSLSGPPSVASGESAVFVATARDAYENTISRYEGTGGITVSDRKAKAPSQVSFNSSDAATWSSRRRRHRRSRLLTSKTQTSTEAQPCRLQQAHGRMAAAAAACRVQI
jgi:hypothetical protein